MFPRFTQKSDEDKTSHAELSASSAATTADVPAIRTTLDRLGEMSQSRPSPLIVTDAEVQRELDGETGRHRLSAMFSKTLVM